MLVRPPKGRKFRPVCGTGGNSALRNYSNYFINNSGIENQNWTEAPCANHTLSLKLDGWSFPSVCGQTGMRPAVDLQPLTFQWLFRQGLLLQVYTTAAPVSNLRASWVVSVVNEIKNFRFLLGVLPFPEFHSANTFHVPTPLSPSCKLIYYPFELYTLCHWRLGEKRKRKTVWQP